MRSTSIEAYKKIVEDGLLSKRKREVYEILYFNGPLTAHEIVSVAREKYPMANQTGFNARLSELNDIGVVSVVGFKKNPISNKDNALWDITNNLPRKIAAPKKVKCSCCNGKGYV